MFNSYQMLQVKIGQVVFPEYEVYITDPLFSSAEDFSRYSNTAALGIGHVVYFSQMFNCVGFMLQVGIYTLLWQPLKTKRTVMTCFL